VRESGNGIDAGSEERRAKEKSVGGIWTFFVENTPSWKALLVGGPLGLAWSCACLFLAGCLKRNLGVRTGYTRKVFHFLIFATVSALQAWRGTPAVCLFGGTCLLVVLYAVGRGDGHLLYEAMAREKDAPHRTYYILVPCLATLAGGLASSMLFGSFAVAGYLVAGLGDAIGEPVGVRFGRHPYRVPSLASVPAIRTWEGSAAVFAASTAAIAVAVALSPELAFRAWHVLAVPGLGLACAGVEAFSPHGWDNATMQVAPAFLAGWIL
jgi:phytol kinase